MHPSWAPRLDGRGVLAQMLLGVRMLCRFERVGINATKVLNASSVGSQRLDPQEYDFPTSD